LRKSNVKKSLKLNLQINRISGLKLLDFGQSLTVSGWLFITSFVFLLSGAPLVFGQGDADLIIGSHPVEFKEVKREFTVERDTYLMRELPFASSKIMVADSRLNNRGEFTLASLSELYYYDGKSVRALSVPPNLITEYTSSLHHLADGWFAVGTNIIYRGKSRRGVTFFNEYTKERLAPCAFVDQSSICEASYFASGKIGKASVILSAAEGLYIAQKDSVRLLPDTKGYRLLGSFDTLALAYAPKSGQCKIIIYQEQRVQMKLLPRLPIGYRARWARKVGDELFVGNKNRLDYYILTVDEKGSSSSAWVVTELPKGKNISLLFPDSGLIALLEDNRYYRLTSSGPIYSDLHNEIDHLIGDDRLLTSIDAGPYFSGSSVFATKNGLLVVKKKSRDRSTPITRNILPGYSTRQMYANQSENVLWVTSYSDLIKLDLASIPDNIIPMPIPEDQKECLRHTNYSFISNDMGIVSIEGWEIKYYNRATKQCTTFLNPSAEKGSIWGLTETGKGSFLIGTGTGLFMLDPKALDEGLIPVPMALASDSSGVLDPEISVQRLKRVGDSDTILVCTAEGLFLTRFEGGEIPTLILLEQVTDKSIHDAHMLPDGSILLATKLEGLLWLGASPKRSLIHEFNRKNYLRSNYTHNIQEDSQGRIWLSSNNGLYVIDLEEKRLAAFGEKDGFPSDEFNRLSSAVLTDSLMVFGGVNGLSFLNPHDFSFRIMDQRSSVKTLKVQQDSQLVVVPSCGYIDSLPYFEIPSDANSFQAVVDAPLFPQTRNVEYRWISDSRFWRPAVHGQISVPMDMEQQTLQLKWNIGLDQYIYSEITVGQKSEGFLFYIQMTVAFFVVLAALFIFVGRIRRHKEASYDEGSNPDHNKQTSTQTEPKPTSPSPPSLSKQEQLLRKLKEKETREYLFDTKAESALLRKTISFVEKEMSSSDFSVEAVADECNLSIRQFHRRIVEETGMTPNQLFTLVRLRHAKNTLIADSSVTVTELANQTGYSNASYFSKKFKAFYGYSPKQLSQLFIELGKA